MNIFENIKAALNQAIDIESKKYNPMFENLVNVVRCKDCKYFKKSDEYTKNYGKCELLMATMNIGDYCSYGNKEDQE